MRAALRGRPERAGSAEGGDSSADDRRLVGIDLGIASAHTVRVLDGDGAGGVPARRGRRVASLTVVEQAALAGAAEGTRLEVVIEPTGPAWLPIAVFFTARGHAVYRVSSAEGGRPAPVPVPARQDQRHRRRHPGPAAAGRPGRAAAAGAARRRAGRAGPAGAGLRPADPGRPPSTRRRIKDLVRQLMPLTPLTGELGQADLAVLER